MAWLLTTPTSVFIIGRRMGWCTVTLKHHHLMLLAMGMIKVQAGQLSSC
jgi:hypothetical protein